MPQSYKPRPQGLTHCPARTVPELEEAVTLLGDTAVLGCELSFELRSLAVNPDDTVSPRCLRRCGL